MSSIPIIQGVAVDPSGKPAEPYYQQSSMTAPINPDPFQPQQSQQIGTHSQQPNQFRDVFWAVLFILHFVPLILYALFMSPAEGEGGDGQASLSIEPHIFWLGSVALVSVGISSISLEGMMRCADGLVKTALIFSVCFSGLIGVMGLLSGQMLMAVLGFISFAIGVCYAKMVWHRIPYAAANLRTGLTAVRSNMGLVFVAYVFMAIAFAWSLLFFMGFGKSLEDASLPVVFCWLLSFYWVHQVLQYTTHVICAGVVGTWWFAPLEASSCFSTALQDSTLRALTYSFGSICFGAFLVAIVRALRVTLEYARQNDDARFLVCILECILRCIEDFIDYLNKWAYVYIGLYGFSYLDAGREVITLFQQKGFTVIITDDLVDNVLFMISICIGLIGGLVGHLLGSEALTDEAGEDAGMVAFGMGFLMGMLFSSITLGVVGSAVNTVIVCYCEAPAEFQANHPQLSNEMRAAWTGAWPDLNLT